MDEVVGDVDAGECCRDLVRLRDVRRGQLDLVEPRPPTERSRVARGGPDPALAVSSSGTSLPPT